LGACNKPLEETSQEQTEDSSGLDEETRNIYRYVNTFAYNRMNVYYLWQAEIEKELEAWEETDEPISKVQEIRYKDGDGDDIDRWTMLTDDFDSFYSSVSGVEKTAGFDFQFYFFDSSHNTLAAVVEFVYADSPADKAGLKRGDTIVKVNGESIPYPDYEDSYYDLVGGDTFTVELYNNGKTLTITPAEIYEDPVLIAKTFDCNGKKVGYLHYTGFTLDSCVDLIDVFKGFKGEGIEELIVDLRYNGGGFSLAEQALASMIAPEDVVTTGKVLSTEVFNSKLTQYYQQQNYDTNTYFTTEFKFTAGGKDYNFSTAAANAGVRHLYFITGSGSASASEALIGDMMPYMDVTVVGEQTHGKYCSGLMLSAEDFYEENKDQLGTSRAAAGKRYAKNWGIYVMYSRFANANGQTICMPDGIIPLEQYLVDDDPLDGAQLGDPDETMLAKVLELCGYKTKATAARSTSIRKTKLETAPVRTEDLRPDAGMMIHLPHQIKMQ